jgi:hypothetical protein
MARPGVVFCALLLSGCNSMLPGLSAPEANATMVQALPDPEATRAEMIGHIVLPALADLDCAPRAGAITCP